MAETVRAAHALPLGFGMVRSDVRIHTLDRFYIGGVAYECIGVSAHTLHEHVEYLTVADAVIETLSCMAYPLLLCRDGDLDHHPGYATLALIHNF